MSTSPSTPKGTCHPAVSLIFAEMERQGVTLASMSSQTGISPNTLCHWKRFRSARLVNIEACLNVLGLRLTVEALPPK